MVEKSEQPHAVDTVVGSRIRLRRMEIGVSQQNLARAVGITFQQVQKYERGTNRVSSSMLYEIARTLHAPLTYFFEGLPDTGDPSSTPSRELSVTQLASQGAIPETVLILGRMTLEQQRYIRTCAEGLLRLAQSGAIEETLDPPIQLHDNRGARKSNVRIRLERLARDPIGTKLNLPYGTFASPKAATQMASTIGGSGWVEITHTNSGYLFEKIAEPKL